jgi:hypothetical protein
MDESHDTDEIRCRRLGHPVPFRFCRCEGGDLDAPCRLLRDCWWERFDVARYVRANCSPAVAERLEADAPPPDKVLSLVDLIRQAQERVARDASASAAPSPRGPDDTKLK